MKDWDNCEQFKRRTLYSYQNEKYIHKQLGQILIQVKIKFSILTLSFHSMSFLATIVWDKLWLFLEILVPNAIFLKAKIEDHKSN